MSQSIVSLWLNSCIRPRETIQVIIDHDPTHLLMTNLLIGTALGVLFSLTTLETNITPPLIALALIAPVIFLAYIYLFSWAYAWTGKYLGGHASPEILRATIVWAIPASIFSSSFGLIVEKVAPFFDAYNLLSIAMYIWVMSISIRYLMQVQGFSIERAIVNHLLASLVLIIPVIGLVVIVALLQ